jgi:hypothetical protein
MTAPASTSRPQNNAREGAPGGASGWGLAAIATAAALLLILFYAELWRNAPFRGTDSTEYLQAAKAIATRHFELFQPRTPGFPVFTLLAGTGRMFFLISLALHMAAVGMLAGVLLSLRVDRRLTALFAAVAVLPSFVQKDAYLLTEGLYEFFLIAGFAALLPGLRGRGWLALSGVAFGLATITRPQAQLLPFVLMGVMLYYFGLRGAARRAAWLLAPFCILVGSLMVNNFLRYHNFELTYDLGYHLGTRTVDLFEDIPDPAVRQVMVATRNESYGDPNRNPIWTSLYTRPELMRITGKSAPELAHYMQRIHMRLILGHPLAYAEEVGRALLHFWLPDLSKPTNGLRPVRLVSMATQLVLSALFLTLAVMWGGLAMGRLLLPVPEWMPDRAQGFLFTAGMATVFYTALLCSALDMGEARYRSTVELIILFLIVRAADFLWNQHGAGERTALSPGRP